MRVATSPDVATQLQKLGFSVAIEAGAGRNANFEDEAYRKAGVTIVEDPASLWSASDIILKVRAPERHPALGQDEGDLLRSGQVLIAFLWPAQNPDLLKRSPKRARPRWRWTACRASRARRRWTR
jgi:NAD(P) transhydrogenase subunit alpha